MTEHDPKADERDPKMAEHEPILVSPPNYPGMITRKEKVWTLSVLLIMFVGLVMKNFVIGEENRRETVEAWESLRTMLQYSPLGTPQKRCSDSDALGIVDPRYVRGYVTFYNESTGHDEATEDVCIGRDALIEATCSPETDGGLHGAAWIEIHCDKGCLSGVCMQ